MMAFVATTGSPLSAFAKATADSACLARRSFSVGGSRGRAGGFTGTVISGDDIVTFAQATHLCYGESRWLN